jgi:hypothetical protein
MSDLKRIAAMNEIRLQECTRETVWVSQRELLEEVRRGRMLPNLPDAEMHVLSGKSIAIKVEISLDELPGLREFLIGLLRGEGEPYDEVWYVAREASVRRQIREVCAQMIEEEVLSEEEAWQIAIKGYQEEEDEERLEPVVEPPRPVNPGRRKRSRRSLIDIQLKNERKRATRRNSR